MNNYVQFKKMYLARRLHINIKNFFLNDNNYEKAISNVRDWLKNQSPNLQIPAASHIIERFKIFQKNLPLLAKQFFKSSSTNDLLFIEYGQLVAFWIKNNHETN